MHTCSRLYTSFHLGTWLMQLKFDSLQPEACMTQEVMGEYPDIRLAYGESDEYSFVFHKSTELYGIRLHPLQQLPCIPNKLSSDLGLRQARQATSKVGVAGSLTLLRSLCPVLANLPARQPLADDALFRWPSNLLSNH